MTALSRILFSLCVLSTFVALLLIARTENVESIPKLDCSWIPSVQPTDTWFLKESSEEVCGGCTFGEVSKLDGTLTIFCSPDSQPHYDLDDDIGLRPYTGPTNIGNSEFVVVHCNTQNDPRTNKTCNINRELIVRNAYNQTIHRNAQQRFIQKKDNVQKQDDTQTTNKLDFLPNIMLLMFDSASMKHAHRRIPNTIQYLHHLNTSAESGVKVFEMQKYNVVGLNSPANFLGFLTGHPHADDLHTESMMYPVLRYLLNDRQKMSPFKTAVDSYDKWIWSQLHKHGYISMFSEGICFDKTLRVMGFSDNIKETYDTDLFGYKPFNYPTKHLPGLDYFFHNAWCQEDNKLMNIYEKTHSHDDKPKCVCLGRKFAHEQTFDYLDEFYRNYPDVPKFSFTAFQEPHDRTMQIFGSMDLSLRDYLMHLNAGWNVTKPYHATSEPLRAPSILQESIVIMFADHGMNFGDYALKQSEGWLEHKQPEMLISVPTSILDKFPEIGDALAHNSHSLLTAYDLFATLMHIPVYPDPPTLTNPQIAQSLFTKIDSARTCEDAYIPDEYCAEKVEKHEVCWQSGHSCEVAAENGRQRFVWDLMQKELDWDPESGDPEPIHVLPEVHLVMHVRHVQMVVDIVCIVLGVTLLFLIGRLLVFLYDKMFRQRQYRPLQLMVIRTL